MIIHLIYIITITSYLYIITIIILIIYISIYPLGNSERIEEITVGSAHQAQIEAATARSPSERWDDQQTSSH